MSSFDVDGFTATKGSSTSDNINKLNSNYVAWNWKAGTEVTNNDGTIESQVSANPQAGFSVVTFTDDGVAGKTIGHGLGQKPSVVIQKPLGTGNWYVLTDVYDGSYDYLLLNTTAAIASSTLTAATATVFPNLQITGNSVAYCFAEVEGYSKIGIYTGNANANGPFVYTGFRPAFILSKRTSAAPGWNIFDSKREGYNVDNNKLASDSTAAEVTTDYIDILSNGFKIRNATSQVNSASTKYFYMAFAENPFKNSNAR